MVLIIIFIFLKLLDQASYKILLNYQKSNKIIQNYLISS
jgi:hypothetical protein